MEDVNILIVRKIKRKGNNMEEIYQTKFQIKVVKMFEGWWSVGINLSHDEFETYIHINFFKWAIYSFALV